MTIATTPCDLLVSIKPTSSLSKEQATALLNTILEAGVSELYSKDKDLFDWIKVEGKSEIWSFL